MHILAGLAYESLVRAKPRWPLGTLHATDWPPQARSEGAQLFPLTPWDLFSRLKCSGCYPRPLPVCTRSQTPYLWEIAEPKVTREICSPLSFSVSHMTQSPQKLSHQMENPPPHHHMDTRKPWRITVLPVRKGWPRHRFYLSWKCC